MKPTKTETAAAPSQPLILPAGSFSHEALMKELAKAPGAKQSDEQHRQDAIAAAQEKVFDGSNTATADGYALIDRETKLGDGEDAPVLVEQIQVYNPKEKDVVEEVAPPPAPDADPNLATEQGA